MVLRGQVLDGKGGGRSQAIGDHQNLGMDLVIQLHLELRIVLRILLQELHLEAADSAIIIDVVEEYLHAIRQRVPNRGSDRAGVGRENAQRNGLVRYIDARANFESSTSAGVA